MAYGLVFFLAGLGIQVLEQGRGHFMACWACGGDDGHEDLIAGRRY